MDTEFHAERRYLPELYLVQIRFEGGPTWLIDPLEEGLLDALAEGLRALDWVVHGGTRDMRLLLDALGGLPARVLDTQIAAGLVDEVFPAPYADLQHAWLGEELDKTATLSDWSRRPLARRQLAYAAEDVARLLDLWDRLDQEARDLDRAELVQRSCADAREAILEPAPSDLAWRDLRAAHTLSPAEAAVLQELSAWREETARRLDQPPHYILSDGLLLELARRQPLTVESLAANRRLSKRVARKRGPEILERIQRAARRPSWAWPQPVSDWSGAGRTAHWLGCLARADGHRERWAARLVLPRRLAEDIARERPESREALAELIGPWRDALVGDRWWDALRGRVSLTLGEADVESH